MDKTENSSRADSQPPWAVRNSVSLRQCNDSNTLQNVVHKMYTPHIVSTRSLGHYAWRCISGILSPEDTWDYGNYPSNLRLCDAGANNIGSAKQSVSVKKRCQGPTSQHKRLHNKRDLKRPISQHKIQSHIIACQAFGNSCLAAWISSSEYQLLLRPV
jgi:hypothetical protein